MTENECQEGLHGPDVYDCTLKILWASTGMQEYVHVLYMFVYWYIAGLWFITLVHIWTLCLSYV